jgi:chromosome segregation protein
VTLRQWYGYHWNRAQGELRDLRQEADSREQKLGALRQNQVDVSRELNEVRAKTQNLRIQLNEWHRKLAEMHAGRQGASRDLAVADERQRALAERRDALEEERKRLESELSGLRARLQEAEQDAKNYQTEQAEAQTHFEEARRLLTDRQGVQEEFEDKTRRLREKIVLVQAERSNAEGQRELLKARIERSKAEWAELQSTIKNVEENLEAARAASSGLVEAAKQAELAQSAAQRQLDETKAGLETLSVERKEAEEAQNQVQGQIARLSAEIQGLEDAEQAAAGFAEGAKLLLSAAQEKRLGIGKGTLGRELRVPAELETAIAAALGSYLDAVVVTDDSEAALSELESRDASAALLPLRTMTQEGRVQAGAGNGLLGVAADLVEVSDELRPAVELLLGRVLVAENRSAARRLLNEYAQATQVVTLRGEVFHRGGQIVVRSAKTARGLARPREERQMRDQLEAAERKLAAAEEQVNAALSKIASAEGRRESAVAELETAQQKLDEARRDQHSQALDAEQLERQLEWFVNQQRSLEREQEESQAQIEASIERDADFVIQTAQAEQALEAHTNSTVDLSMEEQHAQVAHWEMRLAVSQRALQEAQRRVGERQQLLQRAEAQLTAQQERRSELEEQVKALDLEKTELSQQEGTVGLEIQSVQAQIAPAEAELAKGDEQVNSLQSTETQALQALSTAERMHTQAQISLGRQQESLETLRGRIEDDFGLVAFEYDSTVSGPNPLPLGELVERLPVVDTLAPELEDTLKEQRAQIRRLGSVNPEAQIEYTQVKERVESMEEQVGDLRKAEVDLKQVISELDVLMDKEFRTTFDRVAAEFKVIFSRLFNGGSARLLLTEEGDMSNTGIDIEARLPGKRSQRLALLSGGERSLTATALIFSLLKASPTPFCVMDEVDAMLDEANVGRFTELLRELSQQTQFVVITHNRNTVQAANVIYGITMGRDTASQMISLKLDEVDERYSK